MTLSLLGFTMVAVFMYLIMAKRLSALVALMIVPIVFAFIGGFGPEMGEMMLEGVKKIAPTAIMILFAILYFGVMIDAGLFDPLIAKIIKVVKGDPLKIVMGTSVLSMMVALDGDGTTTYMITVSAMLPLYKRLGMNTLVLATVAMLSMGVMNMTPWGGASAMAMGALHIEASELFIPVIPVMAIGLIWAILVSYFLGLNERKRLGVVDIKYTTEEQTALTEAAAAVGALEHHRPKLVWFNLILTIVLIIALVKNWMPLSILFMVFFAVALMVNYPKLEDQKERMAAHAGNALAVVSLVIAAGIFTGILSGTKMVDEMATTLVSLIPESLGSHMPVIVAITSAPFTFFMSNNAYYFGVLPIIAKAAAAYGIDPVEIGRASLLGQPVHVLSPLVAAAYLLIGMLGIEFGELQRYAVKWAFGTTIVMTIAAILFGVISL